MSPEYYVWHSLKARCNCKTNKCYSFYGARGITVCDRWLQYKNFLADMGRRPTPKHTIERIDNSMGYSPDNCRWATMLEQSNNTRKNVWIEFNGNRKTLAQWERELEFSHGTIRTRLKRGWTIQDAITIKPDLANKSRRRDEERRVGAI